MTPDDMITLLDAYDRDPDGVSTCDALCTVADALPGQPEGDLTSDDLREMVEQYRDEHEPEDEPEDEPWTVSLHQRMLVVAVEWGDIEDYYDDVEAAVRRDAWVDSEGEWQTAISEAVHAGTQQAAREALTTASRIESEWGDDPSTQRVAEILGIEV